MHACFHLDVEAAAVNYCLAYSRREGDKFREVLQSLDGDVRTAALQRLGQ